MDNKYLYLVMAAVFAAIGYTVGLSPYFALDGGLTDTWWFASILAIGLGAGNTGGTCAMTVVVEGVKGYIGTLINLAIMAAVLKLIVDMVVIGSGFNVMSILHEVATFVCAAFFVNVILSYLKKAA